jgi:hypothetical protein
MLGPIEIVVLAFPGNQFNGSALPELQKLVDNDTISIIDGVLALKDADGAVTFVEFEEITEDPDATALSALFDRIDGLLSDEDVDTLVADLPLNCAAAVLVFEHTWVKPLRDALVSSGGIMLESIRVPGRVADEVLQAARAAEADGA